MSSGDSNVEGPAPTADSVSVLGPVLIGDAVHLVLFGLLLSTFVDFSRTAAWRASSKQLKWAIAIVLCLVTTIVGLQSYDIWYFGTLQQRELSTLLRGTWPESLEPVLAGLVGAIVESILVARASRFIQLKRIRWPLLAVSAALIITGFLGSLGVTVWLCLFYKDPLWDPQIPGLPTFNNCMAVFLVCSATVDLTISVICKSRMQRDILSLRKKIVGFSKSTDSALKLVMRISLRSALYTAIIAIAGAACSLSFDSYTIKTIDVAWAFFLPLPSLYAMSLFTTLDVKNRLSDHFKGGQIDVRSLPVLTTNRPSQPVTLTKRSSMSGSELPHLTSTAARYSAGQGHMDQMSSFELDSATRATESRGSVSFVPTFPRRPTEQTIVDGINPILVQQPRKSMSMSSIRDVIRSAGEGQMPSIGALRSTSRRSSQCFKVDLDLESGPTNKDELGQQPHGIVVKVEKFVVTEQASAEDLLGVDDAKSLR
ncbi:hypothetical protein OIO90_005406 [Microbotryomycetes sp. JL221]|nr:hypothetical protein OIO90_005406 [Microbotryomycetes sp. JL221]